MAAGKRKSAAALPKGRTQLIAHHYQTFGNGRGKEGEGGGDVRSKRNNCLKAPFVPLIRIYLRIDRGEGGGKGGGPLDPTRFTAPRR